MAPGPGPASPGHAPLVAPGAAGFDTSLFQEFPDPSENQFLVRLGEQPYPHTHTIVYGQPGLKKSTFAATYPKPQIVFLFDPPDKAVPYYRWGKPVPCQDPYYDELRASTGAEIPVTDVLDHETGELLVRVEEYGDVDPLRPTGFVAFEWRIDNFSQEAVQWGSVVVDSLTFCEYGAFLLEQNVNNPGTKDTRQWYGGVRVGVEPMVRARFPRWRTNVILIAHTSEEAKKGVEGPEGGTLRFIQAVGKLGQNLPAGYGEYYHLNARKLPGGETLYMATTKHDGFWMANSLINAPDPCPLQYLALWKHWGG